MLNTAGTPVDAIWHFDGLEVSLVRGRSSVREAWERALLAAHRPLPLPHRSAWAEFQRPEYDSWFLSVANQQGELCGGVGLQVARSRALPGHLLLRCERFGPSLTPNARRAALRALIALSREERRVLRLNVETIAFDAEREPLETVVADEGYTRVPAERCYEHTLLVSLEQSEEEIFAGLHRTARRHVRAADKHPVVVKTVEDPSFFDRLDELSRETYARTGGTYDAPDWARVVTLCKREPTASRLVGLFRTDVTGPESLLAFAWGCGHGDHVHYSRAASTRNTDLKMPLMYPLVWDLIRWGKQSGARWFDFGGITMGTHDSDDPLGGISDFKRYFSERPVKVGAEWEFEPRGIQAKAARLMSSASSLLSRVLTRG